MALASTRSTRPAQRGSRRRKTVTIITPHLAATNAGNWHTAARWARFLRERYRVLVADSWKDGPGVDADALVALHARRSAPSIRAWAERHPERPLVVVLTGTDLYRDIASDADARRSLELATHLVVLNDLGARALPARLRAKASVIVQSAPRLQPARTRSTRHFDVAVVGHLRDEKDPRTVWEAAARIGDDGFIRIRHVGRALDAALGRAAKAMNARPTCYRWLGERTRAQARALMRASHLLLHPSRIEGGAQAVIEALMAGTPVVASRIDGNVGLLGADYPGYFPPGDARRCAALLRRAATDPAFYRALATACRKRASRFDPKRERAALHALVARALAAAGHRR